MQRLGLQLRERPRQTSQRSPQVGIGAREPNKGRLAELNEKAQPVLSATCAMSKSDMMRKSGAKSSTPHKIRSKNASSKEVKEIARSKELTEDDVRRLKEIDERATQEILMKWVEMWMYVKEDVEKMEDINDEEVHETLGSAQIYSLLKWMDES